MEFKELSRFDVAGSGSQGIAFDGTYLYQNNSTILRKYSTAGSLIASRDCSSDGSSHTIVGSPVVVDGHIYATTNNYTNASPKTGYVLKYTTSLAYVTEYNLNLSTEWPTAITYNDGYFWVITDPENHVWRYNDDFTGKTQIPCDFVQYGGARGIQGIAWVDGYLYLNLHEGSKPCVTQKFEYVGGELKFIEAIQHPLFATQGIAWDAIEEVMYFGTRGYGEPDAIVKTKLVAWDHRDKAVVYAEDATERSTNSDSYVEQSHLRLAVPAAKGDLIEVNLQGLFRVTANNVRADIDVSSTSAVGATEYSNPRTIRTSTTSDDGVSLGSQKYFIANDTGVITFAMIWKRMTSGTVYASGRTMTAKITGKATN